LRRAAPTRTASSLGRGLPNGRLAASATTNAKALSECLSAGPGDQSRPKPLGSSAAASSTASRRCSSSSS
jgi:hypothetical protein